jgi:hypothetical protein
VAGDGRRRGPALPVGVLGSDDDGRPVEWHPMTAKWWETWRRSPQAKLFNGTDWDFLLDTALMHHMMWAKGRWDFASEVRLRAAKFGATPEDRARLKMEIDAPGAAPATGPSAKVTDIASRRKRLTS